MSSTMYLSRGKPVKRWVRRHAIPLALVLAATLVAALPAAASHDSGPNPATTTWLEQPQQVDGNDSEACPSGYDFFRLNGDADGGTNADLESGTYTMASGITLTLTVPTDGPGHVGEAKTLDFSISGGVAAEVRLKGGPNGHNVYDYTTQSTGELATGPVASDDYLHSPPHRGSFGGLSHISVCFDEAAGRIVVNKDDDDGNLEAGATFVASRTGFSNVTLTEVANGVHCAEGLAHGDWTVTETVAPTDHAGASPASQTVTVANNDNCTGVGSGTTADATFVNQQEHAVLVIVCHEDDDTLAASAYNDNDPATAALTSPTSPPSGVTEAALCSYVEANGFTDKPHGSESYTVNPGSAAH